MYLALKYHTADPPNDRCIVYLGHGLHETRVGSSVCDANLTGPSSRAGRFFENDTARSVKVVH